jgi:hypothetical protein
LEDREVASRRGGAHIGPAPFGYIARDDGPLKVNSAEGRS